MKQGRSLKEAKAQKAEKKRRAKRRKRVIVLLVELLILAILLGIGYMMLKYDKIQLNPLVADDISINHGVENEGYTTIALFGGDSREGKLGAGTHADTIIVASIDNDDKTIRMVSIYRDLLTMQKDDRVRKANSAYFEDGPLEAINMLNRNFDLDIEDYVTVDFSIMADVVDMLGGIEVDVSDAEAAEMNNYIGETADVVGKKGVFVQGGMQTLDGVQTVTYARIRKNVGGDYARTERQRVVIQTIVEKVKKTDLTTINDIVNQSFSKISTSLTLKEIISMAANVKKYELDGSNGYAFEHTDGMIEGIGSVVIPLGVAENVKELHEFIYPKDTEYVVSDTVKSIATKIEKLSGYTRADYVETGASDEESD